MDSVGKVDHTFSVVGKWIFILITPNPLLNIDSFNLIYACSDEEDYFDTFQ